MNERPQSAIILAAGRGTRLGTGDDAVCKALIDLGGECIIDYQVRLLRLVGIDDITVVVGFMAEELASHVADLGVSLVTNSSYADTNSLFSLCLAEHAAHEGALVLNADTLFHPELLERIASSPHSEAVLVDFETELDEEEMKVIVEDGIVRGIAKDLPVLEGMGENVGIIRIGKAASTTFFESAKNYLAAGNHKAWAPRGIHILVGKLPFHAITVGGTPWTEIDFPEDLEYARNVIYPVCREAAERFAAR